MGRQALWWRVVAALVIGGLVGAYSASGYAGTLDVVISATAVALPVFVRIALDRLLVRKVAAVLQVGLPILIVGGLATAEVAYPRIWQAYASWAGLISLSAVALLAPVSAGFALTVGSQRDAARRMAIAFGTLAWLGVGVHNIVLPYVIPLLLAAGGVFITHAQPQNARNVVELIFAALVTLIVASVYLPGFGLALLGGWGGGVLRARLGHARAQRPPALATGT